MNGDVCQPPYSPPPLLNHPRAPFPISETAWRIPAKRWFRAPVHEQSSPSFGRILGIDSHVNDMIRQQEYRMRSVSVGRAAMLLALVAQPTAAAPIKINFTFFGSVSIPVILGVRIPLKPLWVDHAGRLHGNANRRNTWEEHYFSWKLLLMAGRACHVRDVS